MRKFVFWAALAASLPFCGCLDGSGALEGMIEQALCGVDCDILEVQDSVEDRGKTRRHTYTVTYRVRETLYLKIVMGDRKAVKKLVSPEKQLTATIRVERGRAAADPAILALSDDKLLDMWLMGAAKASASGWHGGVVSERALADIREAYLMEGSADYAAQVARLEEAEAADFSEGKLRHPYTRALWQALPQHGFRPIPGTQPYPGALPEGCPFAPRCPKRTAECGGEVPYRPLDGGFVRCLHPERGNAS